MTLLISCSSRFKRFSHVCDPVFSLDNVVCGPEESPAEAFSCDPLLGANFEVPFEVLLGVFPTDSPVETYSAECPLQRNAILNAIHHGEGLNRDVIAGAELKGMAPSVEECEGFHLTSVKSFQKHTVEIFFYPLQLLDGRTKLDDVPLFNQAREVDRMRDRTGSWDMKKRFVVGDDGRDGNVHHLKDVVPDFPPMGFDHHIRVKQQ